MGWCKGSEIANDVWALMRSYIPWEVRTEIARKIIDRFEDEDADTMDEAQQLCADAGRVCGTDRTPNPCVGYIPHGGDCLNCKVITGMHPASPASEEVPPATTVNIEQPTTRAPMSYFRVMAYVLDRDTDLTEDRCFEVSVPWGSWHSAWQHEYGDRWRLIEVLFVEHLHPNEVPV